jgi:hypothetical protein
MLGWWIVITAKTPQELDLAVNDKSAILATWEAGVGGASWIEELVRADKAHVYRLRGGYPNRYSALAGDVLPLIADGPPSHTAPEMLAWNDEANQSVLIPANYRGNITLHRDRIAACEAGQVLTIDTWDQS